MNEGLQLPRSFRWMDRDPPISEEIVAEQAAPTELMGNFAAPFYTRVAPDGASVRMAPEPDRLKKPWARRAGLFIAARWIGIPKLRQERPDHAHDSPKRMAHRKHRGTGLRDRVPSPMPEGRSRNGRRDGGTGNRFQELAPRLRASRRDGRALGMGVRSVRALGRLVFEEAGMTDEGAVGG